MIEYTSLVESSTGNLTHAMNDLATRGWKCMAVFQEKVQWIAFMERDIAVTSVGNIGWKNVGNAKALKAWGDSFNVGGAGEPELPLSERRALAGDPAAYRSADESKQKEPDPRS